jgi:cytochrome c-type biogenesis protein CcmE
MSMRKVLTIGGIVAIVLCVALILFSASEFVNPYRSVSEISNNTANFVGQQIQMMGEVVNGSIQMIGENMTFEITDGESALNVVYSGATPQNFKEGIDVVAIGSLISEDVFIANEILTKCPSKYE